LIFVFAGTGLLAWGQEGITLTGANGRPATFVGIKDATPKGITAKVAENGPLLGIPWDKLDLSKLEQENRAVYNGYLAAKGGETVALDLGIFGSKENAVPENMSFEVKQKQDGWYSASAGGYVFHIQMPVGEPRGVFFLAYGHDGQSYNMIVGTPRGEGRWGHFVNRHQFALMSYEFGDPQPLLPDAHKFAFADKGSGEAVLRALSQLAVETGKESLVDVPIALFGYGQAGAAFAYNFTQWKPERVMAAAVIKGAFFNLPPTPESVRTPMLLIWGEYDDRYRSWNTEDTHETVWSAASQMDSNWTYAMEFRGRDDLSREGEHVAKQYLEEMIELRIPKELPKPPAPKPAEGDAAEGEGAEGESEEEAEEPVEEPVYLLPVDRSKSLVGERETQEYSGLREGEKVGEGQTWLPSRDIARLWQQLARGEVRFQ